MPAPGVDEQNLFVVDVDSLSKRDDTAAARAEADVTALRALPSVVDTYVTNDYPFEGGGCAHAARIIGIVERTDPARLGELMKRAEQKLLEIDGDRVVHATSLLDARAEAHRGNHGLVVLLLCICAALLTVTGFGIIGLTSYWVSQRRHS